MRKLTSASPLNGPWDAVYGNDHVQVRYRSSPSEDIVVVEMPADGRDRLRVAVFAMAALEHLGYVYGWVLDRLDFSGGKIPANLDYGAVVRAIRQNIVRQATKYVLGPEATRKTKEGLQMLPRQMQISTRQFFPPNRTEVQLLGQDFDLRSDPTYFKIVGGDGQGEVENRDETAAVELYARITGPNIPAVRQARREIESLDLQAVKGWLDEHGIAYVASGGRQAAANMTIAGRGFELVLGSSSFKARSTLAEDVEESFIVNSTDKDAATRLWGLLQGAQLGSRYMSELAQLNFEELPGWLRKRKVGYDLQRVWKDLPPSGERAASVLVLRDRTGRRVAFSRHDLRGFKPSEVVLHAGFEYGVPPSKTAQDIAREVNFAVERLALLAGR